MTSDGSGRALGYEAHLYGVLGEHARAIQRDGMPLQRQSATSGRASSRTTISANVGMPGNPGRAANCGRGYPFVVGAPPGERFGLTGLPAVVARLAPRGGAGRNGEFAEAVAAGEEGLRIARGRRSFAQRGLGPLWPRVRPSAPGGLCPRQLGCWEARSRALPGDGDSPRATVLRGVAGLRPISGQGARPRRCRCWRRQSERSRPCGCRARFVVHYVARPRPISSSDGSPRRGSRRGRRWRCRAANSSGAGKPGV